MPGAKLEPVRVRIVEDGHRRSRDGPERPREIGRVVRPPPTPVPQSDAELGCGDRRRRLAFDRCDVERRNGPRRCNRQDGMPRGLAKSNGPLQYAARRRGRAGGTAVEPFGRTGRQTARVDAPIQQIAVAAQMLLRLLGAAPARRVGEIEAERAADQMQRARPRGVSRGRFDAFAGTIAHRCVARPVRLPNITIKIDFSSLRRRCDSRAGMAGLGLRGGRWATRCRS